MAFWGVEVKPNKPFKLCYDDFEGPRLHLTQATLGKTPAKERVIVKCKVEGSPSVFLCSLLPGVLETCSLNVYFSDDAVFSVEGSASVHLTGYCDIDLDEGSEDEDYYDDESERDYDDYDDEEEEEEADDDSMILTDDSEASDEEALSDEDDPVMVPNRGVTIEELMEGEPLKGETNGLRSALVKHEKNDAQLKSINIDANVVKTNSIKVEKGIVKEKIVKKESNRLHVKELPSKISLDDDASTSEDEDGFPMTSKRKHEEPDLNEPCKKKPIQLLSQSESGAQATPMLKEDGISEGEHFSTPVMKPKEDKKKKKKKVATDLLEQLESPLPSHEDGPIQTPMSGDNTDTQGGEGDQTISKKKKKKNRKKKNDVLADEQEAPSENHVEEVPSQKIANGVSGKSDEKARSPNKKGTIRKYPNGLQIENISMGKPDGKQAKPGKKVGMIYIGKLKSNGKVFDSNVGRKPFVFRLGVGEVIKGWDVGVSGMRLGDKRRLTIPPVMGYGSKGVPGIPPNSWLVFDVELKDVK